MSKATYVAFGNQELRDSPPLYLGQEITCPHCGEHHIVEGGIVDGKESDLLMFYKCGKSHYLCGVKGQSVLDIRKET